MARTTPRNQLKREIEQTLKEIQNSASILVDSLKNSSNPSLIELAKIIQRQTQEYINSVKEKLKS